jgi:hypothetical protein
MRHFSALQYHYNDQVSRTADRPGFMVFDRFARKGQTSRCFVAAVILLNYELYWRHTGPHETWKAKTPWRNCDLTLKALAKRSYSSGCPSACRETTGLRFCCPGCFLPHLTEDCHW